MLFRSGSAPRRPRRSKAAGRASAAGQVSEKSAEELQIKIDTIKNAKSDEGRGREVELVDSELESYVLFKLRKDIPIQMDSFDVQLAPGTVAADTQLTFTSSLGNPVLDALIGGTHNLFVKAKLEGSAGRGKFELQEVRIDGIPVPLVLIETLVSKYVKPKYPDVDLKEPFDLPWGIEEIVIEDQIGRAHV